VPSNDDLLEVAAGLRRLLDLTVDATAADRRCRLRVEGAVSAIEFIAGLGLDSGG
jgi:hypothetical protein